MDYLSKKLAYFKNFATNMDVENFVQHETPFNNPPAQPHINETGIENHKRTMLTSMESYLTNEEIHRITVEMRRSSIDAESVQNDFMSGNVPYHEIPDDRHLEEGLDAMYLAFKPPRLAKPAHLMDVQHHYPFNWQVNAEPPFSTDTYYLDQRETLGEFVERRGYEHINVDDFMRRHGMHLSNPSFINQKVPPKFGFLKDTIFNWTRRWHHVIKSRFTDLAGLRAHDYYLKSRYVFPMLLHTKTAIVKRDDPNKMRTIWGCSKPWIIADTMFYWEYIAWVKQNRGATPMLWGYETHTGGWMRLNAELNSRLARNSFVTLDWSRFDKRAYFWLIARIMQKVRLFLDFSNGYVPTVSYPEHLLWGEHQTDRLQALWEWTLECIFDSKIVLPDGTMWSRLFAGIPSGLYITQLLDSWYNYTMIATILSAMELDPRHCIIKVQGDDSIVRLGVLIPRSQWDHFLELFEKLALQYFNAVVSTEKSEIRNQLNGCEVLSYRNANGFPYRDEIKMLAQMYHTKVRDPTPEITMAQAIGYAYASCGNHERVLLVLEEVYNYYASQGYEPNRAGITSVFGNSPDLEPMNVDLTHFPTLNEIKRFSCNMEYESESLRAFWPRDYFTSSPCS
nr:putative RNA-dependent RNA polymerase [Rhizoctonia solani partitivirus 10]